MADNKNSKIPTHVGLIMDGNGRWAKKRLLPRSAGHNAGIKRMISIAEKAKSMGIRYLTVYALSTENFSRRPQDELEGLYTLIKKYFMGEVEKLIKGGAALKVIGDLSLLPQDVRSVIDEGIKKSPEKAEFTFVIAIGYGSRREIVQAANRAIEQGDKVTEDSFASLLYTGGVPDPDLIIRTGGEMRLSNFLLWQAAYAEFYFTDTLFPDFTDKKFEKAIYDYSSRERRFGGV